MLRFHRTSIFTSQAQTVVNTVNTVGVMGKGIAAEFAKRHPDMLRDYKRRCEEKEFEPGSIWLWKTKSQWVLNFFTKKHWRNPSKIEYVERGLDRFRNSYLDLGIREIAFPRLGCGNGGLDWEKVRPLMVTKLWDLPITVFIHDFEHPLCNLEHERTYEMVTKPASFEEFLDNIRNQITATDGNYWAIGLNRSFSVTVSDDFELRSKDRDVLISDRDDLFRIWQMLYRSPVTRYDLADPSRAHALELFSILSSLPYIRPVNLARKVGRPNVSIEMVGMDRSQTIESNC